MYVCSELLIVEECTAAGIDWLYRYRIISIQLLSSRQNTKEQYPPLSAGCGGGRQSTIRNNEERSLEAVGRIEPISPS